MKKIKLSICAFICALYGLTSCGTPQSKEAHAEGNAVVQTTTWSDGHQSHCRFHINKVMFEGHEYLYVIYSSGHQGYFGITHSGTCPCNNHVQNGDIIGVVH